jgi:cyclophilin family peptidyl-prolyl cis-trans isomerase
MSMHEESAVSRWHESLDMKQFRAAEARRHKRLMLAWAIVLVVAGAMVGSALLDGESPQPTGTPPPKRIEEKAGAMINSEQIPTDPEAIRKLLSNPTNPVVKIDTSQGVMLVELFEDKVPNTVANMVELAETGFYKGMSFHRVIRGFMAQGGCPNSKAGAGGRPGTGGPGYKFGDEFHADLRHDGRGILSMANAGPGTNGSQFFLCFSAQPGLNNRHSVFGKVVAGFDTLDRIERLGMASDPGTPRETIRFNIEVVLKQEHEYHVKKL